MEWRGPSTVRVSASSVWASGTLADGREELGGRGPDIPDDLLGKCIAWGTADDNPVGFEGKRSGAVSGCEGRAEGAAVRAGAGLGVR